MEEVNFKNTKDVWQRTLQRLSSAKVARSVIIKGSTPSVRSQSGALPNKASIEPPLFSLRFNSSTEARVA